MPRAGKENTKRTSYGVYFVERPRNRVIRWDPGNGKTEILAGANRGNEPSQQLYHPYGIAFSPSGDLHISDKLNHRICRLRKGRVEPIPYEDRNGHRARIPESPANYDPEILYCPSSIRFEKDGSLLACFYDDNTIYRIHPDGRLELVLGVVRNRPYLVERIHEHVAPEDLRTHPVLGPTGLVVRSDGTWFYIERHPQIVREYHPARGIRSVFCLAQASHWSRESEAPPRGRLEDYHPVSPAGLALDQQERLYVCDNCHGAVLRIDLERRTFERVVQTRRNAESASDSGPLALAFGPDGTAWLSDSASQSLQAYTMRASGEWSVEAKVLREVEGERLSFGAGGMGLVTGP